MFATLLLTRGRVGARWNHLAPGRRTPKKVETGFLHKFLARSEARKDIEVTDDRESIAAAGGRPKDDPVLVQRHMRQPPGRGDSSSLIAWRRFLRERNSNSRMVLQTTAEGGKSYAFVLDFEFLSRTRSAMQTMRKSALGHRLLGHEP
jgi:hypothetical protein